MTRTRRGRSVAVSGLAARAVAGSPHLVNGTLGGIERRDGNIQLHAERRIKNYMQSDSGESLDPARLAGTMRPCGTCASDLELPPDAHRGPFRQTRPSRYGVDSDHVMAQNQRDGIGTSVTLTHEGAYTFDWNTDSDSDVER
jgi:hypothetical protein